MRLFRIIVMLIVMLQLAAIIMLHALEHAGFGSFVAGHMMGSGSHSCPQIEDRRGVEYVYVRVDPYGSAFGSKGFLGAGR